MSGEHACWMNGSDWTTWFEYVQQWTCDSSHNLPQLMYKLNISTLFASQFLHVCLCVYTDRIPLLLVNMVIKSCYHIHKSLGLINKSNTTTSYTWSQTAANLIERSFIFQYPKTGEMTANSMLNCKCSSSHNVLKKNSSRNRRRRGTMRCLVRIAAHDWTRGVFGEEALPWFHEEGPYAASLTSSLVTMLLGLLLSCIVTWCMPQLIHKQNELTKSMLYKLFMLCLSVEKNECSTTSKTEIIDI